MLGARIHHQLAPRKIIRRLPMGLFRPVGQSERPGLPAQFPVVRDSVGGAWSCGSIRRPSRLLQSIPLPWILAFFLILLAYLLFDLTVTVRALRDVNREAGVRSLQLKQVTSTRDTYKKELREKAARRFIRSRRRLFRAFPPHALHPLPRSPARSAGGVAGKLAARPAGCERFRRKTPKRLGKIKGGYYLCPA